MCQRHRENDSQQCFQERRIKFISHKEMILFQILAFSFTLVGAFSPLFVSKCDPTTISERHFSFGVKPLPFQKHYSRHSDCLTIRQSIKSDLKNKNNVENYDDDEIEQPPSSDYFGDNNVHLTSFQIESFTVTQLKQQLRLRGEKVTGKKAELALRLKRTFNLDENISNSDPSIIEPDLVDVEIPSKQSSEKSKAREFAEFQEKELIDVTAYLDEEDNGKESKSSKIGDGDGDDISEDVDSKEASSNPETWGDEAKIVEDYEGRSIVVDGLSRTVIQYRGFNNTMVQAYVVASRDALRAYLSGGNRTEISQEEQVKQIQLSREKASKVPLKLEDIQGVDEGDEEGYYKNVVEREYGDWGKYSLTGAQLSAQEVQGVLFLPDVYGPFTEDTKMLADKIAFECQPLVVMVPDLFRGNPWEEDKTNLGFNKNNESYEDWRATHCDQRTSVDIRAAAASLREQYGVSSVSLFGTCYGGGRALEAAAGWYPNDNMEDFEGRPGPPPVDPAACVAWYPARYDAKALFGKNHITRSGNSNGSKVAVMAIFAEEDHILGARPEDAAELKALLENDDRVKDHMVKVFPGVGHGFAHNGIANDHVMEDEFLKEEFGGMGTADYGSGDAEVACLLSTAFLETYSRVFMPTIGPSVQDDENESWSELKMCDTSAASARNIRQEIDDAISTHKDAEVDFQRFHPDDFKTPVDDLEDTDEEFTKVMDTTPHGFSPEGDDFETFMQKIKNAAERGDLDYTPGFGDIPLDDTEQAYW
eukprot:CAMPEP_0197827384 /NCGR_PEP_ID=MMETSP1437-20131217/4171_1 /TAXON_ID=49252 ORGANISM="Eucampia antarctica, Strain CCMP1452" /NCGR_SAMPLE_ID=MMETSP1437 /ASSEMBLY_ACC=CAM_ASM_001096 /LENGTH=760 /DNA_ID=CAMNT_0043428213 /DNA_START=94 /DNA_END=2376 /DNA_ORIENTATION=-